MFGVRTMADFYRARALTASNVIVAIVGGMGVMGLLLAVVGLYALVAHAVAQRTREIGIRLAVGARPGNVLMMVMRHGLLLSIVVVQAINASGAIPYSQFTVNLRVFGFAILMSIVFGLMSGVYPAWRMSRLHPVDALKGVAR